VYNNNLIDALTMENASNIKIELLIRKDDTTTKQFELTQCDYNFSTNYYQEEDSRPVEVNLSAGIKNGLDPLFIAWITNQPGTWSGCITIFIDDSNQPAVSLKFDKATATGCNQSFSEYNTSINETYFNAHLKGVVFNDLALN
jgi:hypothetical protein|tara:strand:- start:50351 stop:50779 length:429 start_codon:yes stop_codon:yes gene_type:complete